MAPNTASIRMGSTESTGKQDGSQPFKQGIELKTACGAAAGPVRAENAEGRKECGLSRNGWNVETIGIEPMTF